MLLAMRLPNRASVQRMTDLADILHLMLVRQLAILLAAMYELAYVVNKLHMNPPIGPDQYRYQYFFSRY